MTRLKWRTDSIFRLRFRGFIGIFMGVVIVNESLPIGAILFILDSIRSLNKTEWGLFENLFDKH